MKILKNKLYLWLLAFYNHSVLPSQTDIAKKFNVSRQTISYKMKELVNEGFIIIDDKKNAFIKNPYNINVSVVQKYFEEYGMDFDIDELKDKLTTDFTSNRDNSVIFYKEWLDNIEHLPADLQDKMVTEAIIVGLGLPRRYPDNDAVSMYINFLSPHLNVLE